MCNLLKPFISCALLTRLPALSLSLCPRCLEGHGGNERTKRRSWLGGKIMMMPPVLLWALSLEPEVRVWVQVLWEWQCVKESKIGKGEKGIATTKEQI